MAATIGMKLDVDFLAGGGELGALMRAKDWAATPLGPVATWPQSLRTAISILLNSRYPMFVFWGPHLVKIYNDGYRPILGDKHPWALGRPGPEVWPEIWSDIGPMVERVVVHGEATWSEDLRLFMHRRGFPEEVFFTFSYSPIRDESGGIGGMFCACTETTAKVLGERRLQLLRDLASVAAEARSVDDARARLEAVLARNPQDLPCAAIDLENARNWPRGIHAIRALGDRFAETPQGPWPEPPAFAYVQPFSETSDAVLALGLSSRLAFDEAYRNFCELVAGQVAASIAHARAGEEERRRAEALAELDRAKTRFFSNVSHEFRTPLTLMLGPVEDALADSAMPLLPAHRERLDLVRRSGLRLQRLVNTLLDFSRLEARRERVHFGPVELASLTADVASSFRSAIEKAGLRFVVDCPPLPEPAWVDRDMWEKIVLNLVSNALKFTFEGEVVVSVRAAGEDRFELTVRDTGTGIPARELPHVFERFRRVEGAKSRTHEGTGIGLALVQELARLHGGEARVESVEGRGTTFTVSVPRGRSHLPPEHVDEEAGVARRGIDVLGAEPFVEEALRWLPDEPRDAAPAARPEVERGAGARPRILWADDNADMRGYVRRLLETRYDVEAVADGEAALAAARERRPDLVLADVMTPRLDGLGLVQALRADERTRALPVILLSARVGEEERIEGLGAGADDYLFKPFTARELLARIASRLELEHALREADRMKDEFLATLSHELRNPLAPLRNALHVVRAADPADPALPGVHAMMERQVNHLVRLVDDLLETARITSGAFELRKERIDAATVIRHALETSGPHLEAAAHALEVRVPEEPLWLHGDPVRLAQIVSNLLNNSAKYTEPGGRIELVAAPDGRMAAIAVRDNGPGIAPESIGRLFDMFRRGERVHGKKDGLGIGLALSRRLAQMHGGTVEAHSAGLGHGSTFTVRLPLEMAPAVATATDESSGGEESESSAAAEKLRPAAG